jgi:probable F420-dependent oxidoreductase
VVAASEPSASTQLEVGAVFPQWAFANDAAEIRGYAQAVEEAGYDYLIAYDHVLGVDASRWDGPVAGFQKAPYTADDRFTEVLALFSYLSALTERLTLATSVLILPQRQTALVAKQAAAIDTFSSGRLRLAVGVGWNEYEYEAMGMSFHRNGAMLEDQITVLRKLWSEPLVNHQTERHTLIQTGINPLPAHEIPIWVGSNNGDIALRRVARLADGWMALLFPTQDLGEAIGRLRAFLEAEGRDPGTFPIEARIMQPEPEAGPWLDRVSELEALGVANLVVFAMDHTSTASWWIDYNGRIKELLDKR